VFQNDTLWRAGRARGVHDAAEVLCLWGRGGHWVVLAELAQLVDALNRDIGMGIFESFDVGFLQVALGVVDDMLDVLDNGQGLDQSLDETRVNVDGLGTSLLH
jgi:hypothetical protein